MLDDRIKEEKISAYFVVEEMAWMLEKANKRMQIVCGLSIGALLVTNLAWIIRCFF